MKSTKKTSHKLHNYRIEGSFDWVVRASSPQEASAALKRALKAEGVADIMDKNFELDVKRVDDLKIEAAPSVKSKLPAKRGKK